jgi:hypothetical protein
MEGWMVVWTIVLVPMIALLIVATRSVHGRRDSGSRPPEADVAETASWANKLGNPNGR